MARPRKTMDTHREILRHALEHKLSGNETHAILGVSRGLVQDCIKRATALNLAWSEIEALSDSQLLAILFPEKIDEEKRAKDPDWPRIHKELQRRGVTLHLLHDELVESQNFELSYSQFCRRFKAWAKSQQISMRQIHVGGETLFVDFAGMTATLTDPDTGEVTTVQIFVATLGASNYTYFEAVCSQKLSDWIMAHIHAFQFFGGVPKFLVPDNLKSAVIDSEQFDPILNKTYRRFSMHYRFGVKPARPARPKDKAKVEKAVQHVEYKALARIRDRTFFSLAELNAELANIRDEMNNAPFQKLEGSRTSRFQEIDLPALAPLPAEEFEFEEWIVGYRVPKDYHVNVDGNFYSVPFNLVHKNVDIRFTKFLIEVLNDNTRVASHIRNFGCGKTLTLPEHMTPSHALYRGLSSDFFLNEASKIGPNTVTVVRHLLDSKPHPQLSYSECFGIVRTLKNNFGSDDVELACAQAVRLQTIGYRVVKSVLTAGVKNLPDQLTLRIGNIDHENLRGSDYYQ